MFVHPLKEKGQRKFPSSFNEYVDSNKEIAIQDGTN